MSFHAQTALLHKLNNHRATVAIIDLGYVGLPLAVAFAESGFRVVGINVNIEKADSLNQTRFCISTISSGQLAGVTSGGNRSAQNR